MTSVTMDPGQLALLTAIVDDYCGANDLPPGPERERVARFVLKLFEEGHVSRDDIRHKLIEALLQDELDRHAST